MNFEGLGTAIQSNRVISNSVNSNFCLHRSRPLVLATSHYKRRGKHQIYRTRIYRISGNVEKQRCPRRPQSSFISNVGGHQWSAVRSVSEMRHLPSLSGHKPATGRQRSPLPGFPSHPPAAASVYEFSGRRYLNSCSTVCCYIKLLLLHSQ